MKEHAVIELDKNAQIELRAKKKFPFQKMSEILLSGNTFFIPEIERRTASYVRHKLEGMLEELLDATFSYFTTPEGKKLEGYTFSFSIAKEYYRKVMEEEKNGKK